MNDGEQDILMVPGIGWLVRNCVYISFLIGISAGVLAVMAVVRVAERPRGTIECRADGTLHMDSIEFRGITFQDVAKAAHVMQSGLCGENI